VHALLSLQAVPSGRCGCEHIPVAGSQTPGSWQSSDAVQTTGAPAWQVPAWHVSAWVQPFASLQAVPFGFAGFEHMPVVGSQTPGSWHWSGAGHVTPGPPAHTPAWQVSIGVQVLPSVQAVPFGRFGFEHVPLAGLQIPGS
jgi:hypothetical protein